MRIIGLLAAVVLFVSCAYCQEGNSTSRPESDVSAKAQHIALFRIKQNGKWGFIDRTGKIVIKPQFAFALDFSEGLAAVNVGGKMQKLDWGSEGDDVSSLYLEYVVGGKWGFVNTKGEMVIKPQFDRAYGFYNGWAAVNVGATHVSSKYDKAVGGKWGMIDRNGKTVVPLIHDDEVVFRDGLALIRVGGKQDEHGLAVGGKWGFMDKTGKIVIDPKYDYAWRFYGGLACVNIGGKFVSVPSGTGFVEGGKWGYIDTNGKEVIGLEYEESYGFSQGLAPVKKDGKWGYINPKGVFVIPPRYRRVSPFSCGLAYVESENGDEAFIDRTGRTAFTLDAEYAMPFSEGLAMITKRNGGRSQSGYIDMSGKIVIPLAPRAVYYFRNGLAAVTMGSKLGYIDKTGKYVWEPTE